MNMLKTEFSSEWVFNLDSYSHVTFYESFPGTIFSSFYFVLVFFAVAAAVAHINRVVAEGNSQNTLQALQAPDAGLKAVLPECADTYQSELAKRQESNATEGKKHFQPPPTPFPGFYCLT